ncbi:hypothetical protein [Parasphingorhabdus halotolerans]|uniref:Uncharacterized protein n=1 Tax=Parasphingorhabdus halotolerans TaxID=2725558 RepID=A0A6H2DK62_9SPHN|nr:hypothetical protein [Parasphingorhabdus halotolerans]QJB68527.1 hypothetical protein HF685_03835 [Parasphingorhabdus halotolerans]
MEEVICVAGQTATTRVDISSPDLKEWLEKVSIHSTDNIRAAAINFSDIAERIGLRVALCADIASGKPMLDNEGNSLNADIFGWVKNRERWWEDPRYALHSPIPRACRYESEPFWCDNRGFIVIHPTDFWMISISAHILTMLQSDITH